MPASLSVRKKNALAAPVEQSEGDKLFVSAAKGWRSLWGAKNLPAHKRVYMESVIDKRRDPVTERSFNADELETLRQIIANRYEKIKPELQGRMAEARKNAAQALKDANWASDSPEMKRIYLDKYHAYANEIKEIKSFINTGQLNPSIVLIGQLNGIRPNIQYEDYDGFDFSGNTESLMNTLGRFNYDVDATGNIQIKDTYDFNRKEKKPLAVSDVARPDLAAGLYAARNLPVGKGRPVQIRVNSMAPKPTDNWFNKAKNYLGF